MNEHYYDTDNGSVTFIPFVPLSQDEKLILPDFPVGALPDKIRDYVAAVAESLQVPSDMVAIFVIGIISLCIQGKFEVKVKEDWIEPVNLFLVAIMRPSERKSPALKMVSKPVYDYMEQENQRREPEITQFELEKKLLQGRRDKMQKDFIAGGKKVTKEDVMQCQKELDELEEIKPVHLILDDTTPEALVKAMQENNEKAGIVSAEGGIFGTMAGRYNKDTNIDIFLKSYSGEYYCTTRIGRQENELKHPCLTMVLAVQPKVIQDIIGNSEFLGRGLLARFLFCMPNSMIGNRKYRTVPVSKKIRESYNSLIVDLLNIPDMFGERTIALDDEADQYCEYLSLWIEEKLTGEFVTFEEWAGKLHGNTMRIAGIFHVIEHGLNAVNVPLSKETLNKAVIVSQYYLEHSKAVFDTAGITEPDDVRDAKYIISILESVTRDKRDNWDEQAQLVRVSKRDLQRKCRKFKNANEMEPGLNVLVDYGYIARVELKNNNARPSEIIYLNPDYIEWQQNGRKQ